MCVASPKATLCVCNAAASPPAPPLCLMYYCVVLCFFSLLVLFTLSTEFSTMSKLGMQAAPQPRQGQPSPAPTAPPAPPARRPTPRPAPTTFPSQAAGGDAPQAMLCRPHLLPLCPGHRREFSRRQPGQSHHQHVAADALYSRSPAAGALGPPHTTRRAAAAAAGRRCEVHTRRRSRTLRGGPGKVSQLPAAVVVGGAKVARWRRRASACGLRARLGRGCGSGVPAAAMRQCFYHAGAVLGADSADGRHTGAVRAAGCVTPPPPPAQNKRSTLRRRCASERVSSIIDSRCVRCQRPEAAPAWGCRAPPLASRRRSGS